jgi:type I restriction enzyme R subunit
MKLVSDGFLLKREDRDKKDLYVQLIDYSDLAVFRKPQAGEVSLIVAEETAVYKSGGNIFKMVNQLEIMGYEKRIPDGILYINGLPLVVFEFKSAIREEATIHDAFVQLTVRYKRDIPELFKYNAFCVISDGVNNKAGSFFAPYEFFYAWRKIDGGDLIEKDGIDSLYSMIKGLFHQTRLCDVLRNFVFLPDTSRREEKILCRYPQYYAATKLYRNILHHMRPQGDGKGGTYFGATGCGKSFTMLFLARLLMKSVDLASPTIILITDRTDLDDQLSGLFTNGKGYIGDESVISVASRIQLRDLLKGRNSGGIFLTTIHKFTEDTELLTERNNVICISDEAHRSQVNLDQKVKVTEEGVKRTYGFAKYLHDSLPNATYVGFTGTPIDATLDVFGEVVDAYTMTESVVDEITVRIVYEGRAAKVLLDGSKLQEIEDYYGQCADDGASDYAIDGSKRANLQMTAILGDPDRLKALAADFVDHYEARIEEGATVAGKAMFVSSSRTIAYDLYQEVIALRPDWAEVKVCADGEELTEQEKKQIMPMERIKMVMTRGRDDDPVLYDMLGSKEYRKELDRQFKTSKSNFKIAIVVDMWLTGFDVPFLDSMYIDKPVKRHNLIQTISRVNRKYQQKEKGLIIDYIGIKKQMNLALAHYSKADTANFEDVKQSIVVVRDHLDLMGAIFHKFDSTPYFSGKPIEQLHCLNMAAEYVQITEALEKRFMFLAKRLKVAYDICVGCDEFTQDERDHVHFYMAIRAIVFKLTKGIAPDLAQMNAKVREMLAEALKSDGVEEIFKMGQGDTTEVDIFDPDYLLKIDKIKLPNTKIKLLQQLLAKAIAEFKKVNKLKGVDFSKQFKALVDKYNDRSEQDILRSEVLEDFTDEIIDLYHAIKKEKDSFVELGIDFEEKAFYDILKALTIKYDFTYPEDKLLELAKKVKVIVDDKAKYTDWSQRNDIKAELKVDLIILLAENDYPPIDRDEVYKEIFEQAENFKKYQMAK